MYLEGKCDKMKNFLMPTMWLILVTILSCSENKKFDTTGIRQEIIDTLKILETFDNIPGGAVGPRGLPSTHLTTTHWFEKNITDNEAEILLNHANPFIKTISFRKLWRINHPDIFKIIINSYKDTLMVYESAGCEGLEYSLFDYYIKTAGYPFKTKDRNDRLTKEQKEIIDNLAMTSEYWISYKKLMPPN